MVADVTQKLIMQGAVLHVHGCTEEHWLYCTVYMNMYMYSKFFSKFCLFGTYVTYRITRGGHGHLFSRISASRENIFCKKILGATPSSRSAPTCFGLIAGESSQNLLPLAIRENNRSANPPGYTVFSLLLHTIDQ